MQAHRVFPIAIVLATLLAGGAAARQDQDPDQDKPAFRFRSAVELINVNATVTDESGRFVSGLRKDDFRVYQDDRLQTITHFDNERVPVSLGILLDTSGSMQGEKMAAARRAISRLLHELLGPEDELFLMKFDSRPQLVQGWTTDRRLVSEAAARLRAAGGTALNDAVAMAIPMMREAMHRKKALLIISDGMDTSSDVRLRALKSIIRESEVLIYAIGVDARAQTLTPYYQEAPFDSPVLSQQRPRPVPRPFPRPGGRRGPILPPPPIPPRGPVIPPRQPLPRPGLPRTGPGLTVSMDGVDADALRQITDESGGRTEVIRHAHDLDPATAGIADELSRQYYLGYPATGEKDGRWHTIRVEVRNPNYRVRARSGFLAQ